MKIAVLGDTHFGMRGDSLPFHNHYKKFYSEVFFPYLKGNNIKTIIQLGDLFDRRKFINFRSLYLSKGYFFDRLYDDPDLSMVTFVGNHDIFYKNTLEINSIDLMLEKYLKDGKITSFKEPKTIMLGSIPVDIIPWICSDNEKQIKEFMRESKSHICFGHFEINGFEMDRGHVCTDGIDRESLAKYEIVISGHFHHRSTDGHIYYVGSPGEMTWADYNDVRGFHIFDTLTRELEFVENPFRMFHKVGYDESQETLLGIKEKDFSRLNQTMVKVIVQKKENPFMFDAFMDKLYQADPLDVDIIEDFTDTDISEEDTIDQTDDTLTIINKSIDSTEVGVDRDKLKGFMGSLYREAHDMETRAYNESE